MTVPEERYTTTSKSNDLQKLEADAASAGDFCTGSELILILSRENEWGSEKGSTTKVDWGGIEQHGDHAETMTRCDTSDTRTVLVGGWAPHARAAVMCRALNEGETTQSHE